MLGVSPLLKLPSLHSILILTLFNYLRPHTGRTVIIQELLVKADAVTVPTDPLVQLYRLFNSRIY